MQPREDVWRCLEGKDIDHVKGMYGEDSCDELPVLWLTCIVCRSGNGSSVSECNETDGGSDDESVRGSREQRHASEIRALLSFLL